MGRVGLEDRVRELNHPGVVGRLRARLRSDEFVLVQELRELLADRALEQMHAPVRYRPVEADGAARAARRIAQVLENRWWAQR